MAVVDTLRTHGVALRDILVVTAHLDTYERGLVRAAVRSGVTPTVWRHLPVTEMEPYTLLTAVCRLLDADAVSAETLCQPLQNGWCPPEPADSWPLPAADLRRVQRAAPDGTHSLDTWRATLPGVVDDAARLDEKFASRLERYLSALATQPASPTAQTARDTLAALLDRYGTHVLPQVRAADGPAHR
jgi:hypothetical protein